MNTEKQKGIKKAVDEIFEDLRDRHTLKHLFAKGDATGKIDDETQKEIHKTWEALIEKNLK